MATTRAEIDQESGEKFVTILFQSTETGERYCVRFLANLAHDFARLVSDSAREAERLVKRGRT